MTSEKISQILSICPACISSVQKALKESNEIPSKYGECNIWRIIHCKIDDYCHFSSNIINTSSDYGVKIKLTNESRKEILQWLTFFKKAYREKE